jgi:hypothetical protein
MSDRETATVNDLNGTGEWTLRRVQERYAAYCEKLGHSSPRSLTPREHREGARTWIYPVMYEVILGIEGMDPACIALGIDLIETDACMPFGKTLKANTARALRRSELTEPQKERIRRRVVSMLVAGIVPHEFREYVKLLKRVGFSAYVEQIESETPRENPFAMRFYCSLMGSATTGPLID